MVLISSVLRALCKCDSFKIAYLYTEIVYMSSPVIWVDLLDLVRARFVLFFS